MTDTLKTLQALVEALESFPGFAADIGDERDTFVRKGKAALAEGRALIEQMQREALAGSLRLRQGGASMSTDHDLLEKAAMAAGLQIIRWWYDVAVLCDPRTHEEGATWNPLNDDGDALRLAVKLRISIEMDEQYVFGVCDRASGLGMCECWNDNPAAATRRAIVRAAAALWDAKEKQA